jgi:prolyl oligopeptidase
MRLLAAVLSSFAFPAVAMTVAGVEVPAPLPPRPVSETFWGVAVEDPYRFLEDTKDPAVAQWMQAQADATTAILGKLPGRDPLLARIKEIENGASGLVDQVQRSAGGRWFFLKRDPGENQFKLVWRERVDGPDRLLFDPEALRKATGKPHAVLDFTPSPDGRKIAYAIQAGGGEIGTLHIVDVATGKELIPALDRIRYANVRWLDDGTGFFYSRLREGYDKLPPTERFGDRTVHFHALDRGGSDRAVFSASRNKELKLPAFASGQISQVAGTGTALLEIYLGVDRNVLAYVGDLAQAKTGAVKWRQVVTANDRVHAVGAAHGFVYVKSARGTPRFRVLRFPLASGDIGKAEAVIPETKGVVTAIALGSDALYAARRDGATHALLRVPHAKGAKATSVALPFQGSVEPSADERLPGVVLALGGWTRSQRPWFYEPARRTVAELPFVTIGKFDAPPNIAAREVLVKSHDGVEVPVSILSRPDVKLDGSNPTFVYGYGAYGVTEDPFLSPRWYAWVERGGVIAIAHVRGGGVFGDEWHEAGRKSTKPNTWKDAIAVAEWLVANGYTSPARLGIFGGSAGGIFVGRAITERPDLFAAAVPQVGVFQGTRFEASANGVANVPEFGSVKNEDEFKALMAMSTYEHVKPGTKYPAVLFEHGVNDIRVDVWQTTKMASRLAPATTSGRPVLMRLEYDSGHGQGSTREQSQLRSADTWSFFLWQFGDPAFQPR